jgi:hypothetical protein
MNDDLISMHAPLFLLRKARVQETAEYVCKAFSVRAKQVYNIDNAFLFNKGAPAFDVFIRNYFNKVELLNEKYPDNGNKTANSCKHASAFLYALENRDILKKLFFIKEMPHKSDYTEAFFGHFTYSLCCAFLGVDRSNVPRDVERDFIYNLIKESNNINSSWLMWAMRVFADAYGDKPVE